MKERSIGLDLLKLLMCFEVVLCHLWNYVPSGNAAADLLAGFRYVAVPVFFLVSFFLCARLFTGSGSGIGRRMLRLATPHVFWALAFFALVNLLALVSSARPAGMSDLGWQLLTGHSYLRQMWFQVDLILVTFILWLLSRLSGRHMWLICILLCAAGFVLQYSGVNFRLFGGLRNELKYPLGRLAEMLPYACTGLLLARAPVSEAMQKHRLSAAAASLLVLAAFVFSSTRIGKGLIPGWLTGFGTFQYGGILLWLAALASVVLAVSLPFGKCQAKFSKLLETLSRCTLGVYCIHWIFTILFPLQGGLVFCIVAFVLSMAASVLLSLIPMKLVRNSVC